MDSNRLFLNEAEPGLYELAVVAEDLIHRSLTTAIRDLRAFDKRIGKRITEEMSVHRVTQFS